MCGDSLKILGKVEAKLKFRPSGIRNKSSFLFENYSSQCDSGGVSYKWSSLYCGNEPNEPS